MLLRTRLVFWYTGIFALSGFILTTTLYLLFVNKLSRETDRFLLDEFREYAQTTIEHLGDPADLGAAVRRDRLMDRYLPVSYHLYDTARKRDVWFAAPGDYRDELAKAIQITGPVPEPTYTTLWVGGRQFRMLTGPLDEKHFPHLVLQLAMDMERMTDRIESLREYLAMILATTLLLAGLGGWLLASRSLKPIGSLAADLGQVESRTLSERLEVSPAADEVDHLREAINRMLGRLEGAFHRVESFSADVAHELRTPIAAIQCQLEVVLNERGPQGESPSVLTDVLDQVTHLGTLVENLLFLARMDDKSGLPNPERFELREFLDDLAEPFAFLAEQKGVELAIETDSPIEVVADKVLLRRAVGNLLDNAVRYTPEGGRITVRAAEEGEECVVSVADTGIGIEPEALEHIFDRFYRADASRSRASGGTGLGMSIARRAVDLHRGTIALASTPGEGTTVTVRIPRVSPPDQG